MGWIDKFMKKPKTNITYADVLSGLTPIFSQFGNDIYASDVVQQAIMCIVSELKKLVPTHVVGGSAGDVNVKPGNVQNILNNPNELMTTSEFIEKIAWSLFLNYNSFIIPTYVSYIDDKGNEQKTYTGLYPVQPACVEFEQDAEGTLYIKMSFANNYTTTLLYSDVIHIKYKFSVNDYMGGNESGQPDNEALLQTLQINKDLLDGVSKAMKSSFAVNAVVKYNALLDGEKTKTALADLEQKLKNNENGFLPMDLKGEYIPISRDMQMVDSDTLKFIDEKILRHYGVPLCILTGDYTKEQYEAFYQKTLEPLIKSMSEAFSKALFTQRARSHGNKIVFYPKDLIFMSVQQTLEMVRLLGDSGALYENEKRTAFGLRPLPELKGVRMQSLNYVNVNVAEKYQVGKEEGGSSAEQSEG